MNPNKDYKPHIFTNLIRNVRHKIKRKAFEDYMKKEEITDIPISMPVIEDEPQEKKYEFEKDISESYAYAAYYTHYKSLINQKKDNPDFFLLTQEAFNNQLKHFKHFIIKCTIHKSLVEEILDDRLREYLFDFRKTQHFPISLPVTIEILAFHDNSVIAKIKFQYESTNNYLQFLREEQPNFQRFINMNNQWAMENIKIHSGDKVTAEEEIYAEMTEENLKDIMYSHVAIYKMLLTNLEKGSFIHITDLEKILRKILKVDTIGYIGGKTQTHIKDKDSIVSYLKQNNLIIEIRKKNHVK